MLGGGGSVAFEGLMYICWTGLWRNTDGGKAESADKESPLIEFSSPRAADESRCVSEDSPNVM